MLALNTKIKHHLRNLFSPFRQLEFSSVRVSSDTLIQEIEQEYTSADRNWHLEPYPDVSELESFWSSVQIDLESDPEWSRFGNE